MKRLLVLITTVTASTFLTLWATPKKGSWMPQYDGIDVSHHQGKINWKTVAKDKNIKFVYIKATQGATIVDVSYKENIREARKQGLRCGSYHYLSNQTPIREQFRNFKRTVKASQQDLIPMIDIEKEGMRGWSRKQIQDSLLLFTRLVKKHYGVSPLIYSQFKFYNANLAPTYNRYFLFLGKYSKGRPVINGKGFHNIWQYSDRGKIKGIKGHVDLNCFMHGTSIRHLKYTRTKEK